MPYQIERPDSEIGMMLLFDDASLEPDVDAQL
jgi:hypothetical protein